MAVHIAIRAIVILNGVLTAAITNSPHLEGLSRSTHLGALLFNWIYLSCAILPVYMLTLIWRLASQPERGLVFRDERLALVIDATFVLGFLLYLASTNWLGVYRW